jgi:hypothetical protein
MPLLRHAVVHNVVKKNDSHATNEHPIHEKANTERRNPFHHQ